MWREVIFSIRAFKAFLRYTKDKKMTAENYRAWDIDINSFPKNGAIEE